MKPSQIPNLLTQSILTGLAAPDETHAVRVMLVNSHGPGKFRLRGLKRSYMLERDAVLGRHVIDVPRSLWSLGFPTGQYGMNPSIAHDIQSKLSPLTPFITTIIPWGDAQADESMQVCASKADNTALKELRSLFEKTKAPEWVMHAIHLAETSPAALSEFAETVLEERAKDESQASTEKSQSPAAIRMREKRARDRAAREAAKPQPA